MRKRIAEYGSHGRSVRVFIESFRDTSREVLVRVQWREAGLVKTESLPNSRENQRKAKDFASGVAERLALKGPARHERLTMLELGERYALAHPVPETWRPKTFATWKARWKVWVNFARPDRVIDTVTPDTLDEFRAAMRQQDYAVNQIANHVQMVKAVYRFARERKHLTENPLADYRMRLSRDQRRLVVPEWSADDCRRILAQLDPKNGHNWRCYVGVVLAATLGGRVNAQLHLQLSDVDLGTRTVRWRGAFDKLGRERVQPLPRDAIAAFRIAAVWRRRMGYTGPFIIPGDIRRRKRNGGERPYSYQAFNQALHAAAVRADVVWIDYRALHGFRRYALNNALARTGNLVRAGQWIGDTDARTLSRSYVRTRPDDMRDVAALMDLQQNRNRERQVAEKAPRNPQTTEPAVGIEPTTAPLSSDAGAPTHSENASDAHAETAELGANRRQTAPSSGNRIATRAAVSSRSADA